MADDKTNSVGGAVTFHLVPDKFPTTGLFTLSPNNGSYNVTVGYTSMTYRF